MDRRNTLVIYERREVFVLVLLAIVLVFFGFTYGVHLGKTVVPVETAPALRPLGDHSPVKTESDELPNRQELTEQGVAAPEVSDDALDEALKAEVAKNGARIDVPKQVDLPKDPRRAEAGATKTPHAKPAPEGAEAPVAEAAPPAPAAAPAPATAYVLQVGSFPSESEAAKIAASLKEQGLESQTRPVELSGKGKWYRVYVGSFASKAEAEKAGQEYRSKKWVSSFIVVDAPR